MLHLAEIHNLYT